MRMSNLLKIILPVGLMKLGFSGGGGGGGSTTVNNKSDPWKGVQPYLLGKTANTLKAGATPSGYEQVTDPDGTTRYDYSKPIYGKDSYETTTIPGVYPEAQKDYQSGGWTDQMSSNAKTYQDYLSNSMGNQISSAKGFSSDALNGKYDPNVKSVGGIAGADKINAQYVDPTNAFGSMGSANPSQAIYRMLSGQVNSSALDPVINNATQRLAQNFNEQVMPSIRTGAESAGQYGSSRQGIAEGIAARGLAQSIGDMQSSMYNNAYNTAQSNMYGTANNMSSLGMSNANSNASRDLSAQATNASNQLDAQKFNANLGLQNNAQSMQSSQQSINNRIQGLQGYSTANNLASNYYGQTQNALNAPNEYNWNNLNNYSSIMTNGARLGGTSSQTTPYYTNPVGNALGLASSGLGLYNGLNSAGLLGSSAAANAAASAGAGDVLGTYGAMALV